jgi:hypothetical protein
MLADLILATIFWIPMAICLARAGRFLLSAGGVSFAGKAEEICFGFGLGASLFGTMIWLAGIFGMLQWPALLSIVFLFLLLSFFAGKGLPFNRQYFKDLSFLEKFLLYLSALSLFLAWLAIGSPSPGHDALAYHFFCPKWFISEQKVYPIAYSVNASQPLLVQMLFLFGLMFKSEVFAKLWNVGFLFLTALGAGVLTSHISKIRSSGIFAASLVLLTPGFACQTPYAYVDVALSFFLLLSMIGLCKFLDEENPLYFYGAAFFAGVAAATKILAFCLIVILAPLLACKLLWSKISNSKKIWIFLTGALLFLLPCAGWYLRSWILTGNPVFPYFHSFFTDATWPTDIQDQTGIGRGFLSLLQAPFLIFLNPWLFGGGDSQFGIFFLLFSPLVFFRNDFQKKQIFLFSFLIGGFFIIWFFLVQHLRFLFPAIPILSALFGAVMASRILGTQKRFSWAAFALIATLLLQFLLIGYYNGKRCRYLLFESRSSYLLASERSYGIAQWVNENLKKDAKLLVWNEPSLYYFHRPASRAEIRERFEGAGIQFSEDRDFSHFIVRSEGKEGSQFKNPWGYLLQKKHELDFEGPPLSHYEVYEILEEAHGLD